MDDIETELVTVDADVASSQYGHMLSMSMVLLLPGCPGRHCSARIQVIMRHLSSPC